MLAFSFTVPLTKVSVDSMSPLFIGSARAVVAAMLAGAVVGAGVVIGFPLLTSYALTTAPASHGAMVIALLPAATAVMAVIRGKEHPPTAFWVAAFAGPSPQSGSHLSKEATQASCTGPTCFCSVRSSLRRSGTPRAGCSPANSARGRPCRGRSCCAPR